MLALVLGFVAAVSSSPGARATVPLGWTAALAQMSEDGELRAFRQREAAVFIELAARKAWPSMLERASDTLLKLPDDPFALGWAGLALVHLGYAETGAALMRGGASVIDAPIFQQELSAPTQTQDTTVVVTATAAPLSVAEAERFRPVLAAWANELLKGPEPLSRNLDGETLRAITAFLGELRSTQLRLVPETQVTFDDGKLRLTVRGHAHARAFPPLTLVPQNGDFARFMASEMWRQDTPAHTEISLVRFGNFRLPGVFADACQKDPSSASALFEKAPDADVVVVTLPDAPVAIAADFFGCRLLGSAGSIRVPWLDWPDRRIPLHVGDHEVVVEVPAQPGVLTLQARDYDWMRATVELCLVPENVKVTSAQQPVDCRWTQNVATCVLPTGDFALELAASDRVPTQLTGHLVLGEVQKQTVRLARAQIFTFDTWDAGALAMTALGGVGVAGAFAAVTLTRQGLKDTAGVLPAGKAQEARAVEDIANSSLSVGGALVVLGLVAEAWLLGSDVLESQRLPEWE